MTESLLSNAVEHALIFITGGSGGVFLMGLASHAVDTYPTDGMTPRQLWLLGMAKYITGHRNSGAAVLANAQQLKTGQFPASSPPAGQ